MGLAASAWVYLRRTAGWFLRPGFAHRDEPMHEERSVQGVDRLAGCGGGCHFYVGAPFGPAGYGIGYQMDRTDRAGHRKKTAQLIFCRFIREISHIELSTHDIPLFRLSLQTVQSAALLNSS